LKIQNIKNPDRFFEVVSKCKGTVELITSEGDTLNLKSKLCQYIALAKLFSEAKIDNIELKCSDPDDGKMLLEFLVRG